MCINYTYFCLPKQDNLHRIVVFCKISDRHIALLPWKQILYKHFEFFLFMAFVNQIWVI